MTYDIDYIKQNWLVNGEIPYSEQQVVDAFNEVETTMGQDWLKNLKFKSGQEQFGPNITIYAVEFGLKLRILKNGINYTSLLTKLKSQLSVEVTKGMAELYAIYLICNEENIEFELEPSVTRQGRTPSNPDFRVKKKNVSGWTYVEVKQPDTSKENNAVKKVTEKILQLFQGHDNYISVEIMLLRIPTDDELYLIEKDCSVLFAKTEKTELEMAGLGLIKINYTDSVVYSPFQYEGFNNRPVLAKMQMITETNSEGGAVLKKMVSCRIAVSDERARHFLIDASEQLSSMSSNLVWIDGRFVIDLKWWPMIIADQFEKKPELNKKVSAFVTLFSGIGPKDNILSVLNTIKLIQNESAEDKLPDWLREKLLAAG